MLIFNDKGLALPPGLSFVTEYYVVYGTLRKGGGNYKTYQLGKYSTYIGTFRIQNLGLWRPFFAVPSMGDFLTVDLLKIHLTEQHSYVGVYEYAYQLDSLEGVLSGSKYRPILLKVSLTPQDIIYPKMYLWEGEISSDKIVSGDFFNPQQTNDYPILNLQTW